MTIFLYFINIIATLRKGIIHMNYYNEIKNELINNEVYKKVKDYSKYRNDLNTYYNVGKLLSEAGKHYGEGIIKKYSVRLTNELGKGYTETNLKYFRQFYIFQKVTQCVTNWKGKIELPHIPQVCCSKTVSIFNRQAFGKFRNLRLPVFGLAPPSLLLLDDKPTDFPVLQHHGGVRRNGH